MKTWPVELDRQHPNYQSLVLKRKHPDRDDYRVVIVKTELLLALWARDEGYFLPPVSDWKEEKRQGIRKFLDPADPGIAEMSVVSMRMRTGVLWHWWPPLRVRVAEPVISFTNGRHRARYLVFAGAKTMPVEVTLNSAPLVEAHCGIAPLDDARHRRS